MEEMLPTAPRILVVERDSLLQSLLAELLGLEGYAVSVVRELAEVPAQLAQETFALVLADVYVGRAHPGAFTPAQRLRRQVAPTPVGLLMTLPFAPEEARRAGFAFVVPMPFELDTLLTLVATVLQPMLSAQDQQRVAVVERFFAAREQEDWQAVLDLCTEDVVWYPPTASGIQLAHRRHGQDALHTGLASAAQTMQDQTFLHRYYAALRHGLVARYLRFWTTPEGVRRSEVEVALFHFRGEQIAQIGTRLQLADRSEDRQTG